MISRDTIASTIEAIEYQSVIYASREIDGYNYGSYYIPTKTKPSLDYLDLYIFVLSHILDIIDSGLDYTDFDFTDDDVKLVINNTNELIFYYD